MLISYHVYQILRDEFRQALFNLLESGELSIDYPGAYICEREQRYLLRYERFELDGLLAFFIHEAERLNSLYEKNPSRFVSVQKSESIALLMSLPLQQAAFVGGAA